MKLRFTLVLTLVLAGFIACAQVDYKKLDAYYEKALKEWNVPGMSIGIVKDGKLVFAKGYGTVEVGKNQKPDENTLFAIASNSKAFTSAAIALLVQEGKLKWDDKVRQHLPYFTLYNTYVSEETTIRDLLCHRVGLGTFSGDVIWYRSQLSAEEIIKRVRYLPPAYNFRAGYGYSNLMYITAGEVIRKVTGKSWGEFVTERFLKPLGMTSTVTGTRYLQNVANVATPHERADEQNKPTPWVDWENIGATGGLISSVSDLSQWLIFNMNHGVWGKDTLLTAASRNTLWTPHNNFVVDHTAKNPVTHFRGYGLGWGLSDYHGRLRVGHTGGYDGMVSVIQMLPEEKLGFIMLTNGLQAPLGALPSYTFDRFLGKPERDWSKEHLEGTMEAKKEDTRIADRKKARVPDTKPSLAAPKYAGTYHADIYGKIVVSEANGQLRLTFEHTPDFSATLQHWHYDVFQIVWDKPQSWFAFGTVRFNLDNNLEILSLDFDVPNDDIFFEELKAKRIK
ncbi:MAG: serine hydrolase [Cyclobacteriaceae bacterium]